MAQHEAGAVQEFLEQLLGRISDRCGDGRDCGGLEPAEDASIWAKRFATNWTRSCKRSRKALSRWSLTHRRRSGKSQNR